MVSLQVAIYRSCLGVRCVVPYGCYTILPFMLEMYRYCLVASIGGAIQLLRYDPRIGPSSRSCNEALRAVLYDW